MLHRNCFRKIARLVRRRNLPHCANFLPLARPAGEFALAAMKNEGRAKACQARQIWGRGKGRG